MSGAISKSSPSPDLSQGASGPTCFHGSFRHSFDILRRRRAGRHHGSCQQISTSEMHTLHCRHLPCLASAQSEVSGSCLSLNAAGMSTSSSPSLRPAMDTVSGPRLAEASNVGRMGTETCRVPANESGLRSCWCGLRHVPGRLAWRRCSGWLGRPTPHHGRIGTTAKYRGQMSVTTGGARPLGSLCWPRRPSSRKPLLKAVAAKSFQMLAAWSGRARTSSDITLKACRIFVIVG